MLDHELANLYGVRTKRLNEQVKRNKGRFPENYMFQISQEEKEQVVANCDHLKNLKYSPTLPSVFTGHGYDHQFKAVFDAIRQLMAPPVKKKRLIGFGRE